MTSKGYVHLLYIQCSLLKRHIYRVYWPNCIYSQCILLWNKKINAEPVHKHDIIHAGLHFQRLYQISVYETQRLHMRCFNCYTGINWIAICFSFKAVFIRDSCTQSQGSENPPLAIYPASNDSLISNMLGNSGDYCTVKGPIPFPEVLALTQSLKAKGYWTCNYKLPQTWLQINGNNTL